MDYVEESLEEREKTLFESLVYTLNLTAMQQLGKVADPLLQNKVIDISGATDTYDLLIVLKEKTSGNLSDEEMRFFDKIIANVSKHLTEALPLQDVTVSSVELSEE